MTPGCAYSIEFQSLIGFKINWNLFLLFHTQKLEKFQSLIGFKINWNFYKNQLIFFQISFNP